MMGGKKIFKKLQNKPLKIAKMQKIVLFLKIADRCTCKLVTLAEP